MGRFEFLIETQPRGRHVWPRPCSPEIPVEVIASEWRPAPLGRLGRRLWIDIDLYLEFVAIAEDRLD